MPAGEAGVGEMIEELRQLLARQSIRRAAPGERFTLASGAESAYYCDTKATTLSPHGARLVGEILYRLLAERGAEAVGGLALGATFIATAVALVSAERGRPIYGFTVRSEAKDHGLESRAEESYHPSGRLLAAGRRVAVVEDVVTGGGSVLRAIDFVRRQGCEIVAVVALVDRNEGGGRRLRAAGLPYLALLESDAEGNLRAGRGLAAGRP